jgi:hypothetical protein
MIDERAFDKCSGSHACLMYRPDSLNSIESRIMRMEALLQSSGILIKSPQEEAKKSPSEPIDGQRTFASNDELVNLVISDTGDQKFIGMKDGAASEWGNNVPGLTSTQELPRDSLFSLREVWLGYNAKRALTDSAASCKS